MITSESRPLIMSVARPDDAQIGRSMYDRYPALNYFYLNSTYDFSCGDIFHGGRCNRQAANNSIFFPSEELDHDIA